MRLSSGNGAGIEKPVSSRLGKVIESSPEQKTGIMNKILRRAYLQEILFLNGPEVNSK
jgi:hypothetical protein